MKDDLKKKIILFSALGAICIIGSIAFAFEYNRTRSLNRDMVRLFDLLALQADLERYFIDHQAYPKAEKPLDTNGVTSCSQEWQEFFAALNTPALNDPIQNCTTSFYAYRSDGRDYKIITFPERCDRSMADQAFFDPTRPCASGRGAWMKSTPAAAAW